MSGSDQLPQLPLMLAGVLRPAAELLREIGIPTAPLPRVALTASGTGKFVLYDSRSVTSALRARRARRQGLDPIDLAPFVAALGEWDSVWGGSEKPSPAAYAAARSFLDQLKLELEIRGGVWLRLADYPFPYQSALSIAIEHDGDDFIERLDPEGAYPVRLTHFISSRLPPEALARLAARCDKDRGRKDTAFQDIGWLLEAEAFEFSQRKTLSQWSARRDRFQAAGVAIRGLALHDSSLPLPPKGGLRELGFNYSTQPFAGFACHTEPGAREVRNSFWLQFGTLSLSEITAPCLANMNPTDGIGSATSESAAASGRTPVRGSSPESHLRIDAAHVLGPDCENPTCENPTCENPTCENPTCENPGLSAPLRRPDDHLLEWVRDHYQSGYPLLLRGRTAHLDLAQKLQCIREHAARCSLMWQPAFGEFARWWKLRRQMELHVWRRDDEYEIHASGDFSDHPWAIEIWRGSHLATLPLRKSVLNIRDDGLVFLKAQNKSPAGFMVPAETLLERTISRSREQIPTS